MTSPSPSLPRFYEFAHRVQLVSLLLAVALGFVAALLVVVKPLIGMAAVFGLIVYGCACRKPEIPFAILILSFSLPIQKSLAGIPVNMTDATIVLWGLAWPFLMAKKYTQEDAPPITIPTLLWLTLPLILAALLSLVGAENVGASVKQLIRLVEWFTILPLLLLTLRPTREFWLLACGAFLCIPPLFALDGMVEVLNNGNSLSHMLGIPSPVPSEEMSEIRHTFDVSGRAGSTFGGAQGLAMYLTMMLSVIVAIIIRPPVPALRIAGIIAMSLCLAGLYFAKSRGGFLGCAVMLTAMGLAVQPRLMFRLLVAGGIVFTLGLMCFILFFGWDGTITGLIPGRAEAVLDRLIIWERALSVFANDPINGVGFSGFRDAVYNHGGIQLNVGLGYESLHCHNTYLEVLTGTGLLGFAAYLSFLFLTWKYLLQVWWNRQGGMADCFTLGAIGGLAAYMMFGMVDMLFLQNMHMVLITLLSLGLLAANYQKAGQA